MDMNRFHRRSSPVARKMSVLNAPVVVRSQVGLLVCNVLAPVAVVVVAETMQTSTAVTLAQPMEEAATALALKYWACAPPAAGLLLPAAGVTPGRDV